MHKFNLVSIDWDTVNLMLAGQFRQETFYLEELSRWALRFGRVSGLLHLVPDGVHQPNPIGRQTFSVKVHGCRAVGKDGYLIDIAEDQVLEGLITAQSATVPLYVGVSKVERDLEPELYSAFDTGLLHCSGVRRHYRLATEDSDTRMDWVQIAQFENAGDSLLSDPDFLPESMFLSSHADLEAARDQIQEAAQLAMDALQQHSSRTPSVYSAALALASSLSPAVYALDTRMHPRAYMDRLAAVFTAQRTQLSILPYPQLALYDETLSALKKMLDYLKTDWTLGPAFRKSLECFEYLLRLYPLMLSSLEASGMKPERVKLDDHEAVVPVSVQDGRTPNRRRSPWMR